MYDTFSSDYDRFVNWSSRLAAELPFIEAQLQVIKTRGSRSIEILDTACGTGMHAIALAQRGYLVSGADLSTGMIGRARSNAAAAGVPVQFKVAGFGELTQVFGAKSFDALLCLGNSLPHLLNESELAAAYEDFAACLKPGGLLLIQNRNFDAVLAGGERWMEPQSWQEGESEWIFLRFYDYDPDGLITFNIVTLRREGARAWSQQVAQTRLKPLLQGEVIRGLVIAGFEGITCYGNLAGSAFDPMTSGNLVVSARIST